MCKGKTDNVTCQICNQIVSFGRIKKHIKFNHKDINLENYIQKYYQTLPLHNPCIICKKNIVYKYKTCSKECRNLLINPSKGKPKLGAGGKGISRNKGNIGPFTGKTHSLITKQIQRETIIKNKPHLGHQQSEYQKQQVSIAMKKWYEDGNEPWTKNNKHTPETIENIIKNSKKGMNKLEQEVSNFLTNNNIEHSFNFFINNGNVCKQYDFKIGNILLEIDGDYWHGGPGVKKHHFSSKKTKENDLLKDNIPQERGYKVIRIWQSEIESNPNIILEKIQI